MPTHPVRTNLDACDAEPVNLAGAIQPFGALLTLQGHAIVHRSANFDQMLGLAEKAPAGLALLFDGSELARLDASLALRADDGAVPKVLLTRGGKAFNVLPHRHCGRTFLEFEPASPEIKDRTELDHELATLVSLLDGARTLEDVCEAAVSVLGRASGYDRVMLYRFHEDMHGEVIAESHAEGLESWLGLHYPASDIPKPARNIFLLSKLRVIPDVDYIPVPVTGPASAALDLGRSLLRSASPIHLEYLKNMGVTASLTISLKIRGKLWGLIACHHYTLAKLPGFAERQVYATAGDYVSSAIARRVEEEFGARRESVRDSERILKARMESIPELPAALAGGEVTALDLMEGAGGLAVRYGSAWARKGLTPNIEELDELGRWLEPRLAESAFVTNSLAAEHSPSIAYAGVVSGLIAIGVPGAAGTLVLWFRPEVLLTVKWGGDPAKRTNTTDRLHPRTSFAAWSETVRHRSLAWTRWEVDAAHALRDAIAVARLRYQYELEKVARADAERANRTREEFMAVISHDLRNPLSSVMLNVALLGTLPAPAPIVKSVMLSMDRATKQMLWLIDGLLDIAQAESGALELNVQRVSAHQLVESAFNVISPIALAGNVAFTTYVPQEEVFVNGDEQRILQVLSNLVGNAIKFTPAGGKVRLSMESSATSAIFEVRDTGPGISPDQLPHIFDRFWRGSATHIQGVGLGLSIVKAIVDAHKGEVIVRNLPEGGACFAFALEKV